MKARAGTMTAAGPGSGGACPGPRSGGTGADRSGEALRIAAAAGLAGAAVLAAPEMALATTDTTFGTPLDTVEGIVGGTGGQLAAALAVGAALVGSVLRFKRDAADGRGRRRHRRGRRHRDRDRARRHGDRLRRPS